MNPSFGSLPRQHSNPYVATINPYSNSRRDSYPNAGHGRFSRTLKRLFKFPQMDFEVAVWEMTSLLLAPKKVFRNMYYHKQTTSSGSSTADPAFPYLLLLFTFLTSLAWSLAYASPSVGNILQIALVFTAIHCLLGCTLFATAFFFALPRLLGPGGALAGISRRGLGGRQRGLFGAQTGVESDDKLEWAYCFDVQLRAFFPLWVHLYVLQFLLLPLLTSARYVSSFFANTLYALAFVHAIYIQFLGYGSLPFLTGTQVLLTPLVGIVTFWLVACITGWNASKHLAPVMWCAADLRGGGVGGAGAVVPPP